MSRSRPKRKSKQQRIDKEGCALLAKFLSPWILNEQHEDYGEDFHAKAVRGEDVIGPDFTIQLKSSQRLTTLKRGSVISLKLKVVELVHFLDACSLPVLLVAADVAAGQAYWLFIQEHLEAELVDRNPTWRERSSITVHIPKTNTFHDLEILRDKAVAAAAYMRSRHPDSISNAVSAHKARLEAANPKFRVDIGLEGNVPSYTMHAQENVQCTLGLTSVNADKFQEFRRKGGVLNLPLTGKDFAASGLPRPPELDASQTVVLMFEQYRRKASIEVVAIDDESVLLATLPRLIGTFEGGTHESRFGLGLDGMPVSCQITMRPSGGGVHANYEWNCALSKWEHQEVWRLPYLDDLADFIKCLTRINKIRIRTYIEDTRFGEDQFGAIPWSGEVCGGLSDILSLLCKLRDICRDHSCPATMPRELCSATMTHISDVIALSSGRQVIRPYLEPEYVTSVPTAEADELIRRAQSAGNSFRMLHTRPELQVPVLNSFITLRDVRVGVDHLSLGRVEQGPEGVTNIVWIAGTDSRKGMQVVK